MYIEITGNKIKLVNTAPSDIDQIIEFERLNSKFVHSYSREKHFELLDDIDCGHISIKRIDNDELVGHMIFFGLEGENQSLEFRRIAINQKGNGYGREAIQLLKKFCFEQLNFHRLWLDVYDDNERATKLYESEGFIYEGILRDCIKTGNGYRSLRMYSVLESEYFGG